MSHVRGAMVGLTVVAVCSMMTSAFAQQDSDRANRQGSRSRKSRQADRANQRQRQQNGYPPKMDGANVEAYKKIGDVTMRVWIFTPPDHKPSDRRACAVFFFGGGWRAGNPRQFEQHCRHLASRGMVAMTADYRVSTRHQTKATACVEDGKSAVRWIRTNAERLGVDPDRIVAGGGSAGGHVAACTGVVPGFEADGEDHKVSSRPNLLTLFNPALVLAPVGDRIQLDEARLAALGERMGCDPVKLSPYHQVGDDEPPTIIFHGKADTTVPYETAVLFSGQMAKHGAKCLLKGYADQKHGFFNAGRGGNRMYEETVRELDRFLVGHGYLGDEAQK